MTWRRAGLQSARVISFQNPAGLRRGISSVIITARNGVTSTAAAEWPNTTTSSPFFAPIALQGFSTANDPHMKDPYTEQWNLTVEHQFTNTTSLRGTYTGQHALKLVYNPNLNQIPFNTEGYGASGAPGGAP